MLATLLSIKEAVSFGVSVYENVTTIRGAITGNTVTHRLERIEEKLDTVKRIEEHLARSPLQEVAQHEGASRFLLDDTPLIEPMRRLQRAMGADLIQSRLIEAPEPLLKVFGENPERLLSQIGPLHEGAIDRALLDDPTMVPMVFEKWDVQFVGWIKEGVLAMSLGTDYAPRVAPMIAGRGPPSASSLVSVPGPAQNVLRVGVGMDCQHATIVEAIAAARAGDRIEVTEGHYSGGVEVDKPLEIVAVGDRAKTVWEAEDKDVILWFAQRGRIANLTVRAGTLEGGCHHAVAFAYGSAVLEDSDLTSASFSVVDVRGEEAAPIIRNNTIRDGKFGGISVHSAGRGRIEENEIFGNAFAGIFIRDGGDPLVSGNTIRDGTMNGIAVVESGKGRIEGNEIFGNPLSGIHIGEGGDPLVSGNTISRNGEAVDVNYGGRGRIIGNDLRENARGAYAIADSAGLVERRENRE